MGYHDGRDIPNYWAYAQQLRAPGPHVRAERVVEPARAPVHGLGVVGALHEARRPDELRQRAPTAGVAAGLPPPVGQAQPDARLRLDRPHLSPARARGQLGVLRGQGQRARLRRRRGHQLPARAPAAHGTPGIWNPLPYFDTVKDDGQLGNIQPLKNFYDGRQGQARCRPCPGSCRRRVSEHPPALDQPRPEPTSPGSINAVMQGPDWTSTAIFLAWDDWGGFYDHVVPPSGRRERLRPPRARPRDQPLRHAGLRRPPDAELRRLREVHRGRLPRRRSASTRRPTAAPTRAPTCARTLPILGDLRADFDFSQPPRPPFLLPTDPKTDLITTHPRLTPWHPVGPRSATAHRRA